ncbi:hypothetical protein EZV61_16600 [Corallincola luteus]|uniref:IraD/Gp25-like domain-containing protein n=2 Tax=Corallincola TaxID=1775176 RepID=A0A368NM86_9GAMM|nr:MULTISPECIES: GPW/gp25 family protein [Corallincola]RCU50559.1 hypothetical protein DU002_09070 [Corallincola holothuriorum]TCI01884.1 hypothetical protein EZV61_16600 [Corallincola luteus]
MADSEQIIGRGWSFPPSFDRGRGEVAMTTGIDDIHASLQIIFSTSLGERLMQPIFGCSLQSMVQEPMNSGNLGYIKYLIETAILYHEPRIDAEEVGVSFNAEQGVLDIAISYLVRGSNSRFNFVYPFYINEGEA